MDASNRIVATGYNGPPARLTKTQVNGMLPGRSRVTCEVDCPRNQPGADPGVGYDDCITVHAEANALLFCDRREREGGALYVNSTVCFTCAKLVANSGVTQVNMIVDWGRDGHRDPQASITMLRDSGLTVFVK